MSAKRKKALAYADELMKELYGPDYGSGTKLV